MSPTDREKDWIGSQGVERLEHRRRKEEEEEDSRKEGGNAYVTIATNRRKQRVSCCRVVRHSIDCTGSPSSSFDGFIHLRCKFSSSKEEVIEGNFIASPASESWVIQSGYFIVIVKMARLPSLFMCSLQSAENDTYLGCRRRYPRA